MFFVLSDAILHLPVIHYMGLEQCRLKNPHYKHNHIDLWYLYPKTYMFYHSWKASFPTCKLKKSVYKVKLVSQECHLKFNTSSCTPTTSWHNKDVCLYTKQAKDGNLLCNCNPIQEWCINMSSYQRWRRVIGLVKC